MITLTGSCTPAIGGSQGATILLASQGNRFIAPTDPKAKEVTTHRNSGVVAEWQKWTWRSEGDLMTNGALLSSNLEIEIG